MMKLNLSQRILYFNCFAFYSTVPKNACSSGGLTIRSTSMSLLKRLLPVAIIIVLVASAWLWWNRPRKTDMARYAPSDALIYLECNSLLDIGEAIVNTKAWRELTPFLETAGRPLPGRWLRRLISWTGVGPVPSVILARAQVAAVMLDLGATEDGQTLTVKPEAAILIETHTKERRIRPVVEDALKRFAESAYEAPALRKNYVDGAELIIWHAASGNSQFVATINGSLVIVGNNERAVKACLDVVRGLRPSLQDHPEMPRMRQNLHADKALAFGFVSSANSARLVSEAAPLVLGMAPGDPRFDRIIAGGASRLLTGAGWSSRFSSGGFEDRYLLSLNPSLVSRLQPTFRATNVGLGALASLPEDFYSVTVYKFEDPLATWRALQTGVSGQLDTLPAIMFTSLLKSGLTSYGIEDPEKLLSAMGPELITARLTRDSEKSVLIAQVRDESALRQLLIGSSGSNRNSGGYAELIEIPGKLMAVSFLNGIVLIGQPNDVRRCLEAASKGDARLGNTRLKELESFLRNADSASVATYANDEKRVIDFLQSILRANGRSSKIPESSTLIRKLQSLPYSATETTLSEMGLERRTESPLGQLGTLVSLLFPER